MPKPNFFIVGAPKCGTTAWASYLAEHSQVFVAANKEPTHFCTDLNAGGIIDRAEYLGLYADAGDARVIVDASVTYLLSEIAAQNIADFNPDAKILIMLRNQEEQLPSLHNHRLYDGNDSIVDFEEAWRLSGARDASNIPRRCQEPKFLDYKMEGFFHAQVERFFTAFGPDRVLVFHFDDWRRSPRTFYLKLLEFLGLPDDGRTEFGRANEAKRHRIQFLGSFINKPPRWALKASALAKKLLGRDRPPLIGSIRAINSAPGYRVAKPSEALIAEIRACYAADNALVEKRIWRPSSE
jgi:hypothetical protein